MTVEELLLQISQVYGKVKEADYGIPVDATDEGFKKILQQKKLTPKPPPPLLTYTSSITTPWSIYEGSSTTLTTSSETGIG